MRRCGRWTGPTTARMTDTLPPWSPMSPRCKPLSSQPRSWPWWWLAATGPWCHRTSSGPRRRWVRTRTVMCWSWWSSRGWRMWPGTPTLSSNKTAFLHTQPRRQWTCSSPTMCCSGTPTPGPQLPQHEPHGLLLLGEVGGEGVLCQLPEHHGLEDLHQQGVGQGLGRRGRQCLLILQVPDQEDDHHGGGSHCVILESNV